MLKALTIDYKYLFIVKMKKSLERLDLIAYFQNIKLLNFT